MYTKVLRIDELTVGDHHYLSAGDECYYLGEYTAKQGYSHSKTNQLISNLKKGIGKKNKPEYKHKEDAIRRVAHILSRLVNEATCNQCTFVPVPPSKNQHDALFDDRLMLILAQLSALKGGEVDYRRVVDQPLSIDVPSHLSGVRKSPEELYDMYEIDESTTNNLKDVLLIFDDVITAGSHFTAMKRILSEKFPQKRIAGLFIARTKRSSDLFDYI